MNNRRVFSGRDVQCDRGTTADLNHESYTLWILALALAAAVFHTLLLTGCTSGGDTDPGSNDAAITTDGGAQGDGGIQTVPSPRWPDCDPST
jgi:hypothetical protein